MVRLALVGLEGQRQPAVGCGDATLLDGIGALAARMGQIETDLSRLRSAVYLLSKERPDILRLLGQ